MMNQSEQVIQSVVDRGVDDGFGMHVTLNAPEFFQRKDFLEYVTNNPVLSWHQPGQEFDEWSDVAVLIEPNLTGEGTDEDMPLDIWDSIVCALRKRFGKHGEGIPVDLRSRHIVVRITNLDV